MKISYNWLKQYINISLEPAIVAELLTDCGLEVEEIEEFQFVQGGLKGVVIGEVKTKVKHPDADKLSVTTVDVGAEKLLNIVCGAPNVEQGQKVAVATLGTIIYSEKGNFEIKRSKIRGIESEGMICAEDELNLGHSHEGIMVLDPSVPVGTLAKDYFHVEEDVVFTIGLTPNRSDAMSHLGVARDLHAAIKQSKSLNLDCKKIIFKKPSIDEFKIDNQSRPIDVIIEDTAACPRYCGITISGIDVKESPEWLKNRLNAIGSRPINNIVDITNYLLHETGQPLHAFDADEIKGNKVIIKKPAKGNKIITLDGIERELTGDDLMICNTEENMCIGGVFGGIHSGVTEKTKTIFLESACFSPVSIRRTAKHHRLHTDASFRFERGTDPNQPDFVLKRAAMLIKEIAGGTISSELVDIYPEKIEPKKIEIKYNHIDRLIGVSIDHLTIKQILISLEIDIISENENGLQISVPTFKTDVTREADVIEEILRIYGYNSIEMDGTLRSSLTYQIKPDKEKVQNLIAELLSNNGFYEFMTNSLTRSEYSDKVPFFRKEKNVNILNPLSSDLNIMRQTLLLSGLESLAYNQNRKNPDIKFYEFGKIYRFDSTQEALKKYSEENHLAVFITGRKEKENWQTNDQKTDFYLLNYFVGKILKKLNITCTFEPIAVSADSIFSEGLIGKIKNHTLVEFGRISKPVLKLMDIKQDVFYADFNWDKLCAQVKNNSTTYVEVPKFPEVRRDLAMLISTEITFNNIEMLAYQSERKLLKEVNLFDIYEGEKIEAGKKSYAVSFIFQNKEKTLTDQEIDKIMEKLMKNFKEKLGAVIR